MSRSTNDRKAEQNHWTERGRAASVSDANATGRPRRSVLAFGVFFTMKSLKWFTLTSWALLAIAAVSFVSVYLFAAKIPMSTLVLFGSIGTSLASVFVLIIGLAVTRFGGPGLWRFLAVFSLFTSIISSVALIGFVGYAFLHLSV